MVMLLIRMAVALSTPALLGCGTNAGSRQAATLPAAIPTRPAPTKDDYVRQFCAAMVEYEKRHRAWHEAHRDLNDHHFDESFVSMVQDPLLPIFENPPPDDRAVIATMRDTYQKASAKFREAAQRWKAGDKRAAEAAENEAFQFLFEDFGRMHEEYGIDEQRCSSLK